MRTLVTLITLLSTFSLCAQSMKTEVRNRSHFSRTETIEIQDVPSGAMRVMLNGTEVPSQRSHSGSLLFSASIPARSKRVYLIVPGQSSQSPNPMSCSVRPERYRDLAWENELVCYRIYSKELEWETVSQGIDMWCKRVSTPIIDTLYHRRDYHHDHGEGMDCYKVGRSLGAGASALMHEDKLVLGRNYTSSRILDCGPVRVCFEVDYPADTLPGGVCQKTKRFTLDRGSFFTKVEDRFLSGLPSIETAMGLRRNRVESVELLKDCIFLSEKPSDSRQPELDGTIFLALVCPEADSVKATDKNWCLVKRLHSDRHITYYIASAWSLAPWVKDISSWKEIVKSFRTGLNEPLEVTTNRIRP